MADPLSDVLSLLKPRSHVSAGFDAGGDWSIAFPRNAGIKCYAVVSGGCWLVVDGIDAPVRIAAGDCFLLPSGRPFRTCSHPDVPPVDAGTVFPPPRAGGVVTYNGGGDVFLVGSRFVLSGAHADVGGGYLGEHPVADLSLRWMQQKASVCGLGLNMVAAPSEGSILACELHDSFREFLGGFFSMFSHRYYRAIGQASDGIQNAHQLVRKRVAARTDYRPKNTGLFDIGECADQ